MNTCHLVSWATRTAIDAHRGQVRTNPRGDLPYVVHSLRVANLVGAHGGGPAAIAAAILHDVLEDTPVTGEGWPPEVLAMVLGCTKQKDQNRLTCIENLQDAPDEAILVKLADRFDNLTAAIEQPNNWTDPVSIRCWYADRPLVQESTRALILMARARHVGSPIADFLAGCTWPGTVGPLLPRATGP